jgi:hypothetical protein
MFGVEEYVKEARQGFESMILLLTQINNNLELQNKKLDEIIEHRR